MSVRWTTRLYRIALRVGLALLPILVIPELYDPLGLRYLTDDYQMAERLQCATDDCSLVRMPEGRHEYANGWTATINAQGFRVVPDNAPDCTTHIAVIGDSFVWGPMVGDSDIWINLLAREFSQACFHSYAQYGNNAEQVAQTLAEYVPDSMDHVLYLIFENDDMPSFELGKEPKNKPPPLVALRYMDFLVWVAQHPDMTVKVYEDKRDPAMFLAMVETIVSDSRVTLLGFNNERLVQMVRDAGHTVYTITMPSLDEQISPLDNHPTAAGHARIARELEPFIAQLLSSDSEPQR